MFQNIENSIESFSKISITEERKIVLQSLVDFIQTKLENKSPIRINFICTHNSRRSHLAQVWAQTMAFHFKISNVVCYSGGTERTALFPKVAETLETQGFQIQKFNSDINPIYAIKIDENEHPIIGFSKEYADSFNPQSNFAAVLTCTQADGDCPFILGAEKRIAIPYDDPKQFDNSPLQMQKYAERSSQIASEMYFVFSQISK